MIGVGVLGVLAYRELINIRNDKLGEVPKLIKILGLIGTLLLIYINYKNDYEVFFVSFKLICAIILSLFVPVVFYKKSYSINDAFYMISNVLFLGIAFNLFISLYNYNIKYFILLILITTLTDTFAFLGGSLVGKHKFTSISPNKTIEGSIIGTLIATFVCLMYYINIISNDANLLLVTLIIILLSIVAQIGDLFFSAIKRNFNKKDFSNLIPGHGGILDRVDSIIFVMLAFVLIINYL